VILYEHPFNERVRTFLRLEHLLTRFTNLINRDDPIDHHFAFSTLFEIVEAGGRSDLKSDILKDLERYKQQFLAFRGNPSVSEEALNEILSQIDEAFTGLNILGNRIGQCVSDSEWLSALRNRLAIPGGTCNFDLPAYFAWQHRPVAIRRDDILRWTESIKPLFKCIHLLLKLLRDGGHRQKVMATKGQLQQSLPQGRYQLMRVFINPELNLVPEISGNRMMVWVRMMNQDSDCRLQNSTEDASFEIELCS
jgi:cell division protein ZapD